MPADRAYLAALRAAFAAHADPARAPQMQAYMKSPLPFHGIAAPLRRRLQAQAAAAHPQPDAQALAATALALWRQATHREERYAAAELWRERPHRRLLSMALLPLFEQMIVEGAWWDLCDEISGQALPRLLQLDPAVMKPLLLRWAGGDRLWLRRAAMLAQRGLREDFDAALLYQTLLPSLLPHPMAREFFIAKGMGWALRERSHRAPAEVMAFCDEYRRRLTPLTLREALKACRRRDARRRSSPPA